MSTSWRSWKGCRVPRRAQVAVALAIAMALPGAGRAWSVSDASGCTSLDAVPIQYTIDYQSAIQGIFDAHCIACHSGDLPPADLDLGAGGSWSHLFNVPSSQDAQVLRVVPNHPERSLLFLKVNCDAPGIGQRMPFGELPLDASEQALILDWISAGAPSSVTDAIFRNGLEMRG